MEKVVVIYRSRQRDGGTPKRNSENKKKVLDKLKSLW